MKAALWIIVGTIVGIVATWLYLDAPCSESDHRKLWVNGFNVGVDHGAESLNILRAEAIKQGHKDATITREKLRQVAATIYVRRQEQAKRERGGDDE